jgi:ADP-ribose pyrophosphatase YjhB (NUDIX family)
VISYGIICFRCPAGIPEYLVVLRKDTFSFVDFMRGKYSLENRRYILAMFRMMTPAEREIIRDNDFEFCWRYLWNNANCGKRWAEYEESRARFRTLKSGYYLRNDESMYFVGFDDIMCHCENVPYEPEWGFPKGRRNINEPDMRTAFREFSEEAAIPTDSIMLLSHKPFDETFSGSNGVRYKHVYFVARIEDDCVTRLCANELRDSRWATFEEAVVKFSDTVERVEMLRRTHKFVMDRLSFGV